MSPWILAVAISLFFEGMMIALAPEKWQQVMRQLTELPPARLRKLGGYMVAGAFAMVFMLYGWQK